MSEILREINPSLLILFIVILCALISTLFTLILWFIKRLVKGVDRKFDETNQKLDKNTEKCELVLVEISTTKEAFSERMQFIQGTMDSRTLDIEKSKATSSKALEECKRLDDRIQRTEKTVESTRDKTTDLDKRLTLIEKFGQ